MRSCALAPVPGGAWRQPLLSDWSALPVPLLTPNVVLNWALPPRKPDVRFNNPFDDSKPQCRSGHWQTRTS